MAALSFTEVLADLPDSTVATVVSSVACRTRSGALLTNWFDFAPDGNALVFAGLREPVQAEQVFGKHEDGLQVCAIWVLRYLRWPRQRN